jgi:hypothetical protein
MDLRIKEALDFEWMPDELKDYVYNKYKLDSIYLKTLGSIDKDYVWVVVIYNSDESEKYYNSHKEFEQSLDTQIFKSFPDIKQGEVALDSNLKVMIELFNQDQALELIGFYENGI